MYISSWCSREFRCVRIHIKKRTCVCIYIHMYVCVSMYICAYICTYILYIIYIYIYIYIYVYACMYISSWCSRISTSLNWTRTPPSCPWDSCMRRPCIHLQFTYIHIQITYIHLQFTCIYIQFTYIFFTSLKWKKTPPLYPFLSRIWIFEILLSCLKASTLRRWQRDMIWCVCIHTYIYIYIYI